MTFKNILKNQIHLFMNKNSAMRKHIDSAKQGNQNKHLNFVDDSRNFVNQPNLYANGAGAPANGVKKSMPYAVDIVNASAGAVANVDVLGAYQYINDAGFTAGGSLVIGSITISSAIPGVTYRDLLYQAMNNPFTVGLTYVTCGNVAAQVNQVFNITTKDANGTTITIPIVPAQDPYQQIQTINVIEQEYRLDGFTKLTFANILASASVNLRWYPSDNLNPARSISGQASVKQFGNPGIIRK